MAFEVFLFIIRNWVTILVLTVVSIVLLVVLVLLGKFWWDATKRTKGQ